MPFRGRLWIDNCYSMGKEHVMLSWIIFGLIVGIVAKLLMPGRDPGGFVITILLGIAGALVGGFLGRFLGLYRPGQPAGFIMAVLGSILLLMLYRFTRPTMF